MSGGMDYVNLESSPLKGSSNEDLAYNHASDLLNRSPQPENSQDQNKPLIDIHNTLHSIYNPQEASYTSETHQILIGLHDALFSQNAISKLDRNRLQVTINGLISANIVETHVYPLICMEALPSGMIQALYVCLERFLFCVRHFASETNKRQVKEFFATTPGVWVNVIKQTTSCINFELVKEEPWKSDKRSRISIFELCTKTLQPMLLGIDVMNRVLEIENPHTPFSTTRIENLHTLLLQRLEKENMLDLVVLAAQKVTQIAMVKRPSQEMRALLKPSLYILRACSLVFQNENADEVIRACEYGEKYDLQLLARMQLVQREMEKKLLESLPTRHTRFGGKLLQKINRDDGDDEGTTAVVVDSLQLSGQDHSIATNKTKNYSYKRSKLIKKLPCETNPTSYKTKLLLKVFAEKLLLYRFRYMISYLMQYFLMDNGLPVTSKDMVVPLQSKEDLFRVLRFLMAVNRGNSEAKARQENRNHPRFVLSTETIADYMDLEFLGSFFLFLRMHADPQVHKNSDKITMHILHNILEESAGLAKEIILSLHYMYLYGSTNESIYATKSFMSFIYERENIQALVKLLRHYNPSKNSVLFVADVVEVMEYLISSLEKMDNGTLTVKKLRTHHSTSKHDKNNNNDGNEDDSHENNENQVNETWFDIQKHILPQISKKAVIDKFMLILKNHKDIRESAVLASMSLIERVSRYEKDISAETSVLYNMNVVNAFYRITLDKLFLEQNAMEDTFFPQRLSRHHAFIEFIYKTIDKMFEHFRNEETFNFIRLVFGEQQSSRGDEDGYEEAPYYSQDPITYDAHEEEQEYHFSQEMDLEIHDHTQDFSQDRSQSQSQSKVSSKSGKSNKSKFRKTAGAPAEKPKKNTRLRKKSVIDKLEEMAREDSDEEITFDEDQGASTRRASHDMSDDEIVFDEDKEESRAALEAIQARRHKPKLDDSDDEIMFEDSESSESDSASTEAQKNRNKRTASDIGASMDISESLPANLNDSRVSQKTSESFMSSDSLIIAEDDSDDDGGSENGSDNDQMNDDIEDMQEEDPSTVGGTFGDVSLKPVQRRKDKRRKENNAVLSVSDTLLSNTYHEEQPNPEVKLTVDEN